MLLVETVASNAKFHSSQDRTNQSTVTIVFQSINQQAEEAQVAEDLEAEVAAEVVLAEEVDLTEDHEKCTKQHVATVATNVKYHSSQRRTGLIIVRNASLIIEEIKSRLYFHILWIK